MKKTLRYLFCSLFTFNSLLITFSGIASQARAQTTKISVNNGDWFDPSTWNPVGVPSATAPVDTLIVNTAVTFDSLLDARGVTTRMLRINAGASLTGIAAPDTLILGVVSHIENYGTITVNGLIAIGDVTGETRNDGLITADHIVESDVFRQFGQIDVHRLSQSGSFSNLSGGLIHADILYTSDNFGNAASGIVVVADTLLSTGTLTNDGDVSAGNWINGGTATGTTGKFCIAACFTNGDAISGTVDVCDATPLGFCDVNAGTIAPSVTTCLSGPCDITVHNSRPTQATKPLLYPVPTAGTLWIDGRGVAGQMTLYDMAGKRLLTLEYGVNPSQVDLSAFAPGTYVAQLRTGESVTMRKIMLE